MSGSEWLRAAQVGFFVPKWKLCFFGLSHCIQGSMVMPVTRTLQVRMHFRPFRHIFERAHIFLTFVNDLRALLHVFDLLSTVAYYHGCMHF